MEKCFKCGIGEDKTLLFEAIGEKKIIKICRKCSFKEDFPLIDIPKPEEPERKRTTYERLVKISGFKRTSFKPNRELKDEEAIIKEVLDKNFNSTKFKENPQELIRNFHWMIKVARRRKKLTLKRFAEKIKESEQVLELLEKGRVPNNSALLIKKIENLLEIKISKREEKLNPSNFDHLKNSNLTTSDLDDLQKDL